MSASLRRRYTPVLDQLEHRNLLAGNVLASVKGGVLELLGDVDANQISVVADSKQNVTVSTLDDTTINGLESVTFKKVSGLTVFLREGDDVLDLSNAKFTKPVNIYLGADNDTLFMTNVKLPSKALIALGDGDDTADIATSSGGERLRILAGAGDDSVAIANFKGGERTVIDLGDGDDNATITDSTFKERFQLLAGFGDDRVSVGTTKIGERSQLDGGAGSDDLGLIGNKFSKKMEIVYWQSTTNSLLPTAVDDTASVSTGGEVVIDLAGNDVAPGGTIDPATITIVTDPTFGTVVVNGDGTVTYTHDGSDSTSDFFEYTIQDSNGNVTNVGQVNVTIDAVASLPPTAFDDFADLVQGGNVIISVFSNDQAGGAELDLTSIVITSPPANGTLQVNGDGTVTYTHDGSATVSDSFSYTIKDLLGFESNAATVTLNIAPAA